MISSVLYEVCVESVEAALAAERGGAQRVELCADLLEGGITPSAGTIILARARLAIPVHVLIRPRGGDFCYSDTETEVMRHDIALAGSAGAAGVVLGVLRPDGTVDAERTAALIAAARPMTVTFHRAFDVTRDPFEALEALIGLGVERVLTSGQEPSALEGMEMLAALVARAAGRIIVMPGGGIRRSNVAKILAGTGAREIHFTAGAARDSAMQHRNPRVFMGGVLRPPEYAVNTTDADAVRAVITAAAHG